MKRWEYRVVKRGAQGLGGFGVFDSHVSGKVANVRGPEFAKQDADILAQHLNELGKDGWEVIGNIGMADIVLKRPKQG